MTLPRRVRCGPLRTSAAGVALCTTLALTGCGSDSPAPISSAPLSSATTVPANPTTPTSRPARSPIAPLSTPALPTVDPYAGQPLIERVEWTEAADGARLLVIPTRAGRDTTFPGAEQRAWAEIRTLARAADSPGMYDQFVCHWHWARLVQPNKPSWNLEPWRPDVGYEGTVAASCNPGGPER